MKTLVGIVTFGLLDFTKLAIRSINETTTNELDFYIIVGKPGDTETIKFLESERIPYKYHQINYGFPYSINDIYDYAWKDNNYDNLILAGNDVVAYPYCIDSLLHVAETSDYQTISALQYSAKMLIKEHPEAGDYFTSENCIFTDFNSKPWELYKGYKKDICIADMQLHDIQNLCLYKKNVFDVVGYTDVNFYPAYFIDNDYARRIVNAGLKCCTVANAKFFHFWSRTIKQGSGGSTDKNFENNRKYYVQKWGGDFGNEKVEAPIKIDSRQFEIEIINKWKNHK